MSEEKNNVAGSSAFERLVRARTLLQLKLPGYFTEGRDEPAPELFFYPPSSADLREIFKVAKDDGFLERVETLRQLVLDKDGKPYFQIRDKSRMLNDVPYAVIDYLYSQISGPDQTVSVLLGKSVATTS